MATASTGSAPDPRRRAARFVAGNLADLLVVAVLGALVVAVTRPEVVQGRLDIASSSSILTLVAAAVGSAAAIVSLVVGQLTQDARPSWFGAALLLYGVIVLPTSALVTRDEPTGPARLAVLAMLAVGMCILIIAVRPPPMLGAWGGWALFAVAIAIGVLVAMLGDDRFAEVLLSSPLPSILIQTGWAVVAVLFVIDGYRRQSRALARLGLGLVVVAVSQLYRAVVPTDPVSGLVYPSLRVLGMAVVLSALLTTALRAVTRLRDGYDRMKENLANATYSLRRARDSAAERDHELRNGLAGLAAAAEVLSRSADDLDPGLRAALLPELNRLRMMLQNPPPAADGVDPMIDERDSLLLDMGPEFAPDHACQGGDNGDSHRVDVVLRDLVRLRPDQPITLEVEDDLPDVAAPDTVTRQVVTNLLANCQRHAPGAPIEVRGRSADDPGYVTVEVRDAGPGLPDGVDTLVITRGVHDESAGGSGLGLHISAQLAENHGGELVLRTADEPRGCLAVLTLPVAT